MKRNIPFSPPDMTDMEIKEVVEALKSGWITTGPKTKLFEKKIAEYIGTESVVCLNSATAALQIALNLIGVKEGDEVIVPAYTYTATASVVVHLGAKLVMVDSQENSFEMDYKKLSESITERTKVIIPVDIAGRPCNYDEIFKVINEKKNIFNANSDIQKVYNRVIVLTDAAHAMGAEYKGEKVGNQGDFTAFSFHAVKNLTTAEGGALTWKTVDGIYNEEMYKQANLWSLQGQTKDALSKTKLGAWEYDISFIGYKCNMTDIAAGIGLAQLERYKDLLDRRSQIVRKYDEKLIGNEVESLSHFSNDYESSYHLYLALVKGATEKERNKIIEKMAERGVACNVHYKPLPMMSAYKKLGFDISNFPNAYNLYKREVSLPLHTLLTDDDVNYVIESFKEVLQEIKK